MSIKVTQKVWRAADRLRGNDMLLLLALADYANDHGECWPSVRTLAARMGLCERTIYKLISRAVRAGYITVVSGGGKGRSNRYRLMLEVIAGEHEAQATNPERADRVSGGQTLNAQTGFTSPNPEHSDRVCSPQTLNAGTPNPERSDTQTLNACAGKPSNINRQTNRQDINPPYPPQQAVRATNPSQQQVGRPTQLEAARNQENMPAGRREHGPLVVALHNLLEERLPRIAQHLHGRPAWWRDDNTLVLEVATTWAASLVTSDVRRELATLVSWHAGRPVQVEVTSPGGGMELAPAEYLRMRVEQRWRELGLVPA